jgi:hypothetical protein
MFDMKKFLALLAAIALALLGITKPDIFSPELAEFLSRPVTAKLSLLIGGSVAYAAIVLFAVYVYTSKRERELLAREQKLLVKDQEIEVLNSQLRDRDRLRLLDIVTGIPNQLKWERDVENLSKNRRPRPPLPDDYH